MKLAEQATPNHTLRRARELQGWSQSYVADAIEAPAPSYISRWERGLASPSPFYREKLCRLFEKNAAELGLLNQPDEIVTEITYLAARPEVTTLSLPGPLFSPSNHDDMFRYQPVLESRSSTRKGLIYKRLFFLACLCLVLLTGLASSWSLLLQPWLFPAPPAQAILIRNWPLLSFNIGSRNEVVRTAQLMLLVHGYDLGKVGADGYFGPLTEQAVRKFQKAGELSVNGRIDNAVWEMLIVPSETNHRGTAIQALQRQLNIFDKQLKLEIDGIFGPKVEAAIRAFQQQKGLPAHGKADLDTWCLLLGGKIEKQSK